MIVVRINEGIRERDIVQEYTFTEDRNGGVFWVGDTGQTLDGSMDYNRETGGVNDIGETN